MHRSARTECNKPEWLAIIKGAAVHKLATQSTSSGDYENRAEGLQYAGLCVCRNLQFRYTVAFTPLKHHHMLNSPQTEK